MCHPPLKRWSLPLLLAAWLLSSCAAAGTPLPAAGTTPSLAAPASPTRASLPARVPAATLSPTPRVPPATTTRPTATLSPTTTPTAVPTTLPPPTPTPQPPTPAPLVQGEPLDLSLGWRLDANGHLTAALVGDPGGSGLPSIFLASLGRTVYAVDTRGHLLWHHKTPGPAYALAPMPGGGVAVGDDAGFVTVLDDDGRRLWRVDLGTRVTALTAAPAPTEGLFVGGWDERLTRLDPGGATAWQVDAGGPVTAIATLPSTELVALATMRGQVSAYDTAGQEIWRLALGSPVAALGSLPGRAGVLLLAGVQDGRLVAIDAGGVVAWEVALGSGAPVWHAAEWSPGTWSLVAGTAGPEPALAHLSAAGDVDWRVSMPAPVTAVEVHDLGRQAGTGGGQGVGIAAGLASGQVIVCDAEGRQRAAVHAGLPVSGLVSAPDGSLFARADVVAWQILPQPGPVGNPWLAVPALAPIPLAAAAATSPSPGEPTTSQATLLFLGDVSPGRSMEAQLLRLGPEAPWAGLAPLLPAPGSPPDDTLLVVNLEGVLTTRGEALAKPYLIRAHPLSGQTLAAGSVGLVTLANNHALDYGPRGLDDTLATLDTLGITTVGAGADREEAHRPARFTLNGVQVAVLAYAATRWDGSADVPHTDRIAWAHPAQVAADVRAVRAEVDLVVVLLHAGTEYATTPSPDQVAVAHAAVDAGATLVVGHHPHVTQTVERYKEGLIVYSLGDAVFDIPRQAAMRGHLLRVQVNGDGIRAAELWPFWIDGAIRPRLLDAGTAVPGSLDGVLRRLIYP